MWAPDVYQGSPTSVTTFFAILPKIAALSVFIRFLYVPFAEMNDQWQMIIIFLSIASMIFGAVAAIGQKNLKRLVNYYNKLQLYQILDKCSQLKDPKIHLIANRLHDIQMDERSAIERVYSRYLQILSYIPIITFIALIILFYEIIRRFVTYRYSSRV